MSKQFFFVATLLLTWGLLYNPISQVPLADTPVVEVLNVNGDPITSLVDGDTISLHVDLAQSLNLATEVTFHLSASVPLAVRCTIKAGGTGCQTDKFLALGWYWDSGHIPQPQRSIEARLNDQVVAQSLPLQVAPRPVVMVHGFASNAEAWKNYLGAQGFLARAGLRGYAVGDGQVPGVMNTGSLADPAGRTNTIAQNAAILGEYIANVKKKTGAQKVDLLVHSMGGMISRYYIDRLMPEGEVAQLIILGTPMAGSDCANLPAALGFYLPASLEIQPSYMKNIFNQQINRRREVPFLALAGDPIHQAISSPCTAVPSDLVVSLDSVTAIPMDVEIMALLHTDLNTSEEVFTKFVLPRLAAPVGEFPYQSAQVTKPQPEQAQAMQFSRVYTGHIAPGEQRTVSIPIDAGVAVASFALIDTSHSLEVEVRGASGNLIALDPVANGLIRVDDPESLLYLGYGFNNPKAGAWQVTLIASPSTPAEGADYALTASFRGGAKLMVQAEPLLPRLGEAVLVYARLLNSAGAAQHAQIEAVVRDPNGAAQSIIFEPGVSEGDYRASWSPATPGLHSLEVHGRAEIDGLPVERSAFMVFEAQPSARLTNRSLLLLGLAVCLTGIGGLSGLIFLAAKLRSRRRGKPSPDQY